MAINYAEKYSGKVDERFTKQSITDRAVNKDYDWDGVNTVNVYSIGTAELNDYSTTGLNRYGDPEELGDAVQTMVLTQDKSFTFTIDRSNYTDTMMTKEAGKALRREIDEVIVPYIDRYRLAKIAAGAGHTGIAEITSNNAYEKFLDGVLALSGPEAGRVAYVNATFYKAIRLDDNFIKASDIAQDMLVKGSLGEVEGVQLVNANGKLPSGCDFIICHPVATVGVNKLQDYKTHENPPGINGWLVEGRVRFDAFVLNNKRDAIYAHWESGSHTPAEITQPENIPNATPSITLNKAATSVAVGANETLVATIHNAPADTAVTWASSVAAKATVSNKGKVVGVATGNTVVTATITVDNVEYNAACDVTVVSA